MLRSSSLALPNLWVPRSSLLEGFGFLSRMYGLSVDNLVEVDMVLADGHIVTVSEEVVPGEMKLAPVLF
ncbi:hypothetical protein AcV7_001910 [Taiwanofungus camphoratus]|nr:hypothetical protein AcV7_001910 [Antrodia cinnamomea]